MLKLKPVEPINFRIIVETLTRIGVFSKNKKNTIYQKCFLIKIDNNFYLTHYKEIMGHDLDTYDKATLNTVALLLQNWRFRDKPLLECESDPKNDEFGTLPSITVLNKEKSKEYKKISLVKDENIIDFIVKMKVNQLENNGIKNNNPSI